MFLRECKNILKSVIYFAFILVTMLFYVSQLGDYAGNDIKQSSTLAEKPTEELSDNPLIPPKPGQDNYGYKPAEIPEQVMPQALVRLLQEYETNEFSCYATGFYRGIKLSDKQLAEIEAMFPKITGLSEKELYERYVEKAVAQSKAGVIDEAEIDFSDAIPVVIDYSEFKEMMARIDQMIGGNSYYAADELALLGREPVTYEERLAEYNTFLKEDQITGAYARLFCDYMGIVISLFAVFVPVSFLMRDRRVRMNEMIYTRQISSARLVVTRYLALVFMTLLPMMLLSMIPTVQLAIFGAKMNLAVDCFAFLKYIVAWLLPSALITTAVAYIFTMLTDTPVAILIQFLWSFLSMFADTQLSGQYGFALAIRHNMLGGYQVIQDNMKELVINRLSFTSLSLVLILITIYIYSQKRRGKLDVIGTVKATLGNRKATV